MDQLNPSVRATFDSILEQQKNGKSLGSVPTFSALEIYRVRHGGYLVRDGRTLNNRDENSEILYASSNLSDAFAFIEDHLFKT